MSEKKNLPKMTIGELARMKAEGRKISMITAYDYPTARIADRVGLDILLVGDSVGMTVLGYENTLPVTMEEMLVFTKAVARGAKRPFILGDMPYMSYQVSNEEAVRNAGRLIGEAGADGVKLEGGFTMLERIKAIVAAGIPVMGHLGLTPQSLSMMGGFKVQGNTAAVAKRLYDEALALEDAGVFAILLELIPAPVAEAISRAVRVPTISIGSGVDCDGQCLIFHDLIGLFEAFVPRHVKQYGNVMQVVEGALSTYVDEVRSLAFPKAENTFRIKDSELEEFKRAISS
ncbi:MAG: 3-methyl-2-oxobutanoate hydroxymethyltransferase [Firmicutes bacterium]|nr:3-methyl-2-oxobutanoate hydroxymethyltransferase [Bacillota bacterium]